MVHDRTDALRGKIRDALRSDDFQRVAPGLSEVDLFEATIGLFKKRAIGVTLLSVRPTERADGPDFVAVWQTSAGRRHETNPFSLKRR